MAKFLTDYAAGQVINWLRGITPTPVSNLKLALYTAAPPETVGGTKVTGGSYTDQAVTLAAPSSGASSNSAVVTFVNMPTCTVVAAALVDGVSGDVLWVQNGLSISITAGENKAAQIGDLDVAFIAA